MSGLYAAGVPQRTVSLLTGAELVPADTQVSGGAAPQEATIPLSSLAAYAQPVISFRNVLDCPDFSTNPWQRGTAFATISNTLTYTADRFFAVGGASSSINVSKAANTDVPGFTSALQFQRTAANTDTAAINLGQVIESGDAARLQGQTITLSFWAKAGANFSALNNVLNVSVYSGTGSNQSAANMVAGSWTGSTILASSNVGSVATVANYLGASSPVVQAGLTAPSAFAAGLPAQFNLTTTMTRYQMTVTIPANCNQIGVLLSYTPTGTAGANDWYQLHGIQLESGAQPSAFEHRDVALELELAQRYFWQQNEPAAGVIVGSGMNTTSAVQVFYIALPMTMRIAPTVTVSAGTFKTNQSGTATTTTISAGSTHTQNAISVNGNSAGTAGQATLLQGGGGSGYIQASAEF